MVSSLFCHNESSGRGDTVIRCSSQINYKCLDLNCFCSAEDFEICAVSWITPSKHNLKMLTCYRSPEGN